MLILIVGPCGTGKTVLANALKRFADTKIVEDTEKIGEKDLYDRKNDETIIVVQSEKCVPPAVRGMANFILEAAGNFTFVIKKRAITTDERAKICRELYNPLRIKLCDDDSIRASLTI